MSRRVVQVPRGAHPHMDLTSHGRRGPQASPYFSPAQREQIARTVGRAPEVMVKVTGGGTHIGAVRAHLAYISRHGKAPVETDDEQHVQGKDALKAVLNDWHLELSKGQYRRPESGKPPPRALKLVHNIVLSMPAPTPPKKVLAAAQKFAREKFALEHRYAMVLHTDQKHPHVHVVVKAEGLHGKKLHIDKAMLREWREDFARLMREEGVEANASRRIVHGRAPGTKRDEILRARLGGNSTFDCCSTDAMDSCGLGWLDTRRILTWQDAARCSMSGPSPIADRRGWSAQPSPQSHFNAHETIRGSVDHPRLNRPACAS